MGAAIWGALPLGASLPGADASWVSWVKAAAGAMLLLVAAWQFRTRPKGDAQAELPKWVARIDEIKPLPATGLGVVMGLNPKNVLLVLGGATAIAQTGIPAGEQAIAYVVFALVGVKLIGDGISGLTA